MPSTVLPVDPPTRTEFSESRLLRARQMARSIWTVAILLLLMLGGMVAFALTLDYRELHAQSAQRVSSVANVAEASLTMAIESVGSTLRSVAQHVDGSTGTVSLADYLSGVGTGVSSSRLLVVLNPLGRVLASSDDDVLPRGRDFSGAPFYRFHISAPDSGLYIGQPVDDEKMNFFALPISLAVRGEEGNLMAVVVAMLTPRELAAAVLAGVPDVGQPHMLITFDEKIIATVPSEPSWIGQLEGYETGEEADEGRGLKYAAWAVDNVPRVIAYRSIPPWPLVVEAAISQREAMAGFIRHLQWWLAIYAVAALLTLLIARKYVQQILRLSLQSAVIERQNTDLRQASTQLRQEISDRETVEYQRDSFFNLSADFLCVLDSEGRFVRVNGALVEALGGSEAALKGINLTHYVHPLEVRDVTEALDAVEEGAAARAIEVRCRTATGYRWFFWTFVSRQGLLYAVAHDITTHRQAADALREAKEAAESANETKTQFLANMSHELRTPLNAIIGFAETMEMGLYGKLNDKQLEYVRDISGAGRHLLEIVTDLLDLSVIDSGAMTLKESVVDPSVLLQSVANLLRARAEEAGLRLEMELPPETPRLKADEGKMRQILINLMGNAIKFTPAGGTVSLRAAPELEQGGYHIIVADTGKGIPEGDLAQVLMPFGRIKSAYSRAHGGVGLGLPLANRLAELHGGNLTISSTEGQGTVVYLWLPPARLVSDF